MKFLLALSVLASATAFAGEQQYKCWETAQERGSYPTFVFEVDREYHKLEVELKFPYNQELRRKHGCLVGYGAAPEDTDMGREEFKACLEEGQRVHGLIPVSVEDEYFEGTVYCEKGLKEVFEYDHDETMM